MKRKSLNYNSCINLENILFIYKIIHKNTKNKKKLEKFEDYFSINITNIYTTLLNRNYDGGTYNIFTIKEPKERIIMSQGIADKVINHFISYYYLTPLLEPSLIDTNVATRKNKGTNYAIVKLKRYLNEIKNKDFYILKCDIRKFFYNIDHNVLKNILKRKIKDNDILSIVYAVIDSSNNYNIYNYGKGLPIGNMSSQILAIYYLNELDHFIKEQLHIKYYIRYMDDFILIHESKEYLKFCLRKIKTLLDRYKLELNQKTVIISRKNGLNFLGYKFILDKKVVIKIPNKNRRKINKKLNYLYKYDINKYYNSLVSYKGYLKYTNANKRYFKNL